jgi:hypothetical protein
MRSISIRGAVAVAVLTGALLAPAGALAATKPTATTGKATSITPTGATLNGGVNPNGAATTYLFQFGTTRLYESKTGELSAGKGTKGKHVKIVIAGVLAPDTTYHYRLVARNSKGLTFGKDRTFKTHKQPLGVSLAATPNPIHAGAATVLAGVLSGTGNGNRQVQLQANPWPYTSGFQPAPNNQVTDANGNFSFPLLSVAVNTQYRVLMPARPDVVSPIVVLGTTVKVTRHAKVRRGNRRGRIHFWGTVRSAQGTAIVVVIQKRHGGTWVNIGQTTARDTGKGFSRYSGHIRQKHGGRYRVAALDSSGAHSPSVSRSVTRRHLTF